MKKEIRVYFNLDKELDRNVYEYLSNKRSVSSFIIDMIQNEIYSTNTNILIAHKLEAIAEAINSIQTFNLIPTENIKTTRENQTDIELKLNDNFDDDY